MKKFTEIMIKVAVISAIICALALGAEYVMSRKMTLKSTGSFQANKNYYVVAIHDGDGKIIDYLWESSNYVDDSCLEDYWVFAPEGVDMWNMTDYGYTAVRYVGTDYPEYSQYIVHK